MPRLIAFASIFGGVLALSASAHAQSRPLVEIVPLISHTNDINSVTFSKDGQDRFVVSSGDDGLVKLWDVKTGRLIRNVARIDPNYKSWRAISLSGDGRRLLGTAGGDTKEWDTLTGREVRSASNPVESTNDEDNVYRGSRYYAVADNATLTLKDLKTEEVVRTILGQPSLKAGSFSATGSRVAVAAGDNVSVRDADTGQGIGTCPATAEEVRALAFSSDGRQLLYGGKDNSIVLCDVERGTTADFPVGHEGSVRSVAFSADSRRVASGDDSGTVKLWEVATGRVLHSFKGNQRAADSLAFSPDGRKLFAGTDDNKVRIWDTATGRELKTLRMLVGPVTSMAVSPDGRRVAAGPYSQLMVKQWDIETGKELRRLTSDYGGRFTSADYIKYAAGGQRELAASANHHLALWDIDSGRKKFEVSIRDQDFKSISFSNDGRRLVSLDDAGVVKHWDKNTGALLSTVMSIGNGEWLRVTPEGFFDGSADAAQYLTVVQGLEVYSIDRFRDRLYRPDLVREKLAGDQQGKVREAAAKLDLAKAIAGSGAP